MTVKFALFLDRISGVINEASTFNMKNITISGPIKQIIGRGKHKFVRINMNVNY